MYLPTQSTVKELSCWIQLNTFLKGVRINFRMYWIALTHLPLRKQRLEVWKLGCVIWWHSFAATHSGGNSASGLAECGDGPSVQKEELCTGCLRVHLSSPIQSTHALWSLRQCSIFFFAMFCRRRSKNLGLELTKKSGHCTTKAGVWFVMPVLCGTYFHVGHVLSHGSRHSQGPETVQFEDHMISSLLFYFYFADDVIQFTSSNLQCGLGRLGVKCEAASMSISISKVDVVVLSCKKVVCLPWISR